MSIYQRFIESASTSSNLSEASKLRQNETSTKSLNYFNHLVRSPSQPIRPIFSPIQANNNQEYELSEDFSFPLLRNYDTHEPEEVETEGLGCCSLMENRDALVLYAWLKQLRFDPELETMSRMEAGTLTSNKNCASLMAIKCSYVFIRDLRKESKNVFISINNLINECLPLDRGEDISHFHSQFSELEESILNQIVVIREKNAQLTTTNVSIKQEDNPLTITFSTPRKSRAVATTLKPVDRLAEQIKTLCYNYTKQLDAYMNNTFVLIDNGLLESELRTLEDIYTKFLDIVIRAECLIIIEALHYNLSTRHHKTQSPYNHLPLKWSLVALWILTDSDEYLTSLLTEKWQPTTAVSVPAGQPKTVSRRLNFDDSIEEKETNLDDLVSLLARTAKQVSPISLLIEVIINQPNKHRRFDVVDFVRFHRAQTNLIDLDDSLQESLKRTSAIYTGNQYKAAALRILNHFCVNDNALRTILRAISNYLAERGNQFIESIFKPYIREFEHIYQNEATLNDNRRIGNNEEEDPVVVEALSLFIQLTNPFHQSQQPLAYLKALGSSSIDSLVKHLSQTISVTSNREILLLSLSVLANVSFITTQPIDFYGTHRILLNLLRAKPRDLELRDQAVTMFANLAQNQPAEAIDWEAFNFIHSCLDSCLQRMFNWQEEGSDQVNGIEEDFIKSFGIENRPRTRRPIDAKREEMQNKNCNCDGNQSNSCKRGLTLTDLKALERIHQKAAVSIARLILTSEDALEWIVRKGTIKLLIDLCKSKKKRNCSDIVLVSCIKALKKSAEVIDRELFKSFNALDLVDLDLKRVVEIYGN